MDISGNIRDFRKRVGLNQFELADAVGISVDTVRRWESNKQFPRADELVNLASALHITVDELLNGSQSGQVRITLSYDWEQYEKGEINMDGNEFDMYLGSKGQIGLKGAGMLTSREAIDEFLLKIKEQLEIALDAQYRRGVIAPQEA